MGWYSLNNLLSIEPKNSVLFGNPFSGNTGQYYFYSVYQLVILLIVKGRSLMTSIRKKILLLLVFLSLKSCVQERKQKKIFIII